MVNTQSAEAALGIRNEDSVVERLHDDSVVHDNGSTNSIIQPIAYNAKNYGVLHPHYTSEANRIPFSLGEKKELQKIVEAAKIAANGKIPEGIASICLAEIKNREDLIPIFHVRHILCTGRLRPGLKSLGYVQ